MEGRSGTLDKYLKYWTIPYNTGRLVTLAPSADSQLFPITKIRKTKFCTPERYIDKIKKTIDKHMKLYLDTL